MKSFLLIINLILEHWPNRAHFHLCWLTLTTNQAETTVLYQRHHSLYKLQQKHPTSRRSNLGTFDIRSLHTNIPQEEGINITLSVKISHPNKILGDLKRLLLKENFFNDKDKHYLETLRIAIGTKNDNSFRGCVHGSYWETGTSYKPT